MDLASRLGGLPNPARSNTGYLRMRLAPSLACVARIRKWHRTANESGAAAIFFVIRAFRALLHTRHAIAVLQVQRVFRRENATLDIHSTPTGALLLGRVDEFSTGYFFGIPWLNQA
jgi:hypothetical protein